MARPRRIEYSGALYHITSRGNAQAPICHDDCDRQSLLALMAEVVRRYHFLCYAYCLMGNHYHFLLETQRPNLSIGLRHLNGTYTQRFNRRHRRVGHLFQGRFKAILVEKESHLLELCRYIVLNPVRAGVVQDPTQWPWSSYGATVGQAPRPAWLAADFVLRQFHLQRDTAQRLYQAFVDAGLHAASPWRALKGQIYLGSDAFCSRFQGGEVIPEIPRLQRRPVRPALAEIFRASEQEDHEEKAVLAFRSFGYRFREIAEHLGVHYTTVSRWVRSAEVVERPGVECDNARPDPP